MQGSITQHNLISAEAALLAFPFGQEQQGFRPYAFAGFGRYISNRSNERSVIPIGVGVEYPVLEGVTVNAELAGRWTYNENVQNDVFDVYSGILPSLGVSYELSNLWERSPEPVPQPSPVADRGASEEEQDEAGPQGIRPQDAAGTAQASAPSGAAEGGPGGAPERRRGVVADRAPEDGQGQPIRPGAAEAAPTGGTALAGTGGNPVARQRPNDAGATYDPAGLPVRGSVVDTTGSRQMVLLPDGTFIMGLTDEDPLQLQNSGRKRVTVSAYYMDRFEVSNADYRWYLQQVGTDASMQPDSSVWSQTGNRSTWEEYYRGDKYADYPVIGVTYDQAVAYCEYQGKRLPTEAEWEYAARAGLVGGIYPWSGFEPRDAQGRYLANYNPGRGGYAADGYAFTAPVMAYPPNRWGLYNMSGNVAEWVADAYSPTYSELSDFNPLYRDADENRRIVRGGSWASDAFFIGVGVRDAQPHDMAAPTIGFRCVRDLTQASEGGAGNF